MTPNDLWLAVAKRLEEHAFDAEQARQREHVFTGQERVAFRLGFMRGLLADVSRADQATWDKAAKDLTR